MEVLNQREAEGRRPDGIYHSLEFLQQAGIIKESNQGRDNRNDHGRNPHHKISGSINDIYRPYNIQGPYNPHQNSYGFQNSQLGNSPYGYIPDPNHPLNHQQTVQKNLSPMPESRLKAWFNRLGHKMFGKEWIS